MYITTKTIFQVNSSLEKLNIPVLETSFPAHAMFISAFAADFQKVPTIYFIETDQQYVVIVAEGIQLCLNYI